MDPETLAAFREELLPRRKAARVAKHLASCTRCSGLDAQLADLPALLADVPAPPMPDALATRIAAAIAEEAAARSAGVPAGAAAAQAAAAGDAAAAAQPGDAADDSGGRRPRRAARAPAPSRSRQALRIATAAAVVVVVVGGGFGVSRLFSGTSSPTASGASGAAPAARVPHKAAIPGPNQGSAGISGSKEHSAASSPAGYRVVATGTRYRSGLLGAQVKSVLSRSSGSPLPAAKGTSSTIRMADLISCVSRVAGTQRPQLVDLASYNGRPATVIVLPAGANALRVLVVGPRCSATITDLLASTTLHRVR